MDVLKTYAIFYVNENDDFGFAKKIEMLNYIHHATEAKMLDLFQSGEIVPPTILDEVDDFDALCLEAEYLLDFKFPLPGLPGGGASLDDIKKTLAAMVKAKQILKQKFGDAEKAVKDAIKSKINAANKNIDMLQHKLTGSPKPESAAEKIVSGGKELAQQAKEKVVGAAEKVGKVVGKAVEYAGENPGTTAAAVVGAAAALTAGVMAYRRFMSKAGRACKDAPDKGACKREYHNKGLSAQMDALSAGKSKCFKTNNPEKCKAKVDVKIAQVKSKMKG